VSSQFGGFFTGDTAHNRTLDAVNDAPAAAASFASGVMVCAVLNAPDERSADAVGPPMMVGVNEPAAVWPATSVTL
jgi:hypothetical protein